MSKKHFQAFAARIHGIENLDERKAAALAVADVCKEFNPNFNVALFFIACGLN